MSKFIQSVSQAIKLRQRLLCQVLERDTQGSFEIMGRITIVGPDGVDQVFSGCTMLKLSIEDITKQLSNIDSIFYAAGNKYSIDYFDIVVGMYSKQQACISATLFNASEEGKKFFKTINELFNDPSKEGKLYGLGAKNIDFALMHKDYAQIKEILSDTGGLNILEISTKLRFLEIVSNMDYDHDDNDFINQPHQTLPPSGFSAIHCKIDGYPNPIPLMKIHIIEDAYMPNLSNDLATPKTLAILISDRGGIAWHSKILNIHYKDIMSTVDKAIVYGNGNQEIFLDEALDVIHNARTNHTNMESVMIIVLKHGSRNDIEIAQFVHDLPDSFSARETIYIMDTCYGGEFHTNYNKKACLVTFDDGITKHNCSDNLFYDGRFSILLKSNPSVTHSIIEFYGTKPDVFTSLPYISGEINGSNIHKRPIHELYNEHNDIVGQQLISPIIEARQLIASVTDILDYTSDNYHPCVIL